MRTTSPAARAAQQTARIIVGIGFAAGLLGGCSSRMAAEDEQTRLPSAPMVGEAPRQQRGPQPPQDPPFYGSRQGVGAGPVWMDDPAKRRGPQGQHAPYGRDTITGRPLNDLPPSGTPEDGARSAPRTPAAAPSRFAAPGAGNTIVVGKGETLYGLARRYNVTVDALMRANNLTADNKLQAGQTLVIPSR